MNTSSKIVALTLGLMLLPFTGCKSAEEKERARAERAAAKEAKEKEQQAAIAAAQAEIKGKLPADSPLVKLEFGMSEAEVAALLGVPTSQKTRATGKAFNPLNVSGKDSMRTTYFYQGVGRVMFSSGRWGQRNGVVDLVHDAAEPGAEPPKDGAKED
ncbi:MAG: hypothetical protein WAT39_06380 [Planctomycetota bacterium]